MVSYCLRLVDEIIRYGIPKEKAILSHESPAAQILYNASSSKYSRKRIDFPGGLYALPNYPFNTFGCEPDGADTAPNFIRITARLRERSPAGGRNRLLESFTVSPVFFRS
jgi:hypothetical protein